MKEELFKNIQLKRDTIPSTFKDREKLLKFHNSLLSLFIPCYSTESDSSLLATIESLGISLLGRDCLNALEASYERLQDLMLSDAQSILQGDPAAKSLEEVFLCYPGFFAAATHRIAHALSERNISLLPRILAEYAHQITGIDIHPGASIGESFCIDHGTGVVIGETCIIGKNVKIYQGVTLGALSVNKSLASTKRHPTIEDNVVIYANATILGSITIGEGSVIGGNVWLDASVPAKSKILKKENQHDI